MSDGSSKAWHALMAKPEEELRRMTPSNLADFLINNRAELQKDEVMTLNRAITLKMTSCMLLFTYKQTPETFVSERVRIIHQLSERTTVEEAWVAASDNERQWAEAMSSLMTGYYESRWIQRQETLKSIGSFMSRIREAIEEKERASSPEQESEANSFFENLLKQAQDLTMENPEK